MNRKTPWRAAARSGAVALAFASLAQPACESSTPPIPGGLTTPGVALDCGADAGGDWPMYGGNICNTRVGAGGGPINPATAAMLAVKWKLDMAGDVSATPAVVAGQVYVPDWGGMVSRIDGPTGKPVWTRSVADILGMTGADAAGPATPVGRTSAGLIARTTPAVGGGRVVFGLGTVAAILAAVDENTGILQWQTSLDSHVAAVITGSPALDDGRVYVGVSSSEEGTSLLTPGYVCCSFRGSVAAVDAATGRVLWQTPMIDDAVYRHADGALTGYSGAAVWSGTPAIDHKRGVLYVTTGNNYSVPPGVDGGAVATSDGGGALPDGDRIESIVALDLATGKVRWSSRMTTGDVWTFGGANGPDYDFGDGAHLYQASVGGSVHDFVGAGQKSGIYWALDPDTGAVLWKTQVGPGGHLGGIHWGTAVDSSRIYVGVNDQTGTGYTLGGTGEQAGRRAKVGSWAALDPASGATLWQVADPALDAPLLNVSVNGPVSVVNGVVFGGSMDADGTMFAFDASSGKVLWSFKSGATVYSGPAIADGVVYWGNGYPSQRLFFGTPGHTLYAFAPGH